MRRSNPVALGLLLSGLAGQRARLSCGGMIAVQLTEGRGAEEGAGVEPNHMTARKVGPL